jgi:hypothetical protein
MQEKLTVASRVRQLIKREVGRLMKPYGLTHVEVYAGEDQDNDPILIIEATYKLSKRPIDPAVVSQLTTELRDKLWKLGERRFPHIHHRFAEGQKVVGYR